MMTVGLHGQHQLTLAVGGDASENGAAQSGLCDLVIGKRAGIDPFAFKPDLGCGGLHRARIVPGDDLDLHALLAEIIERRDSFGADFIEKQDKPQYTAGFRQAFSAPVFALGKQKDTVAFGGAGFALCLDIAAVAASHDEGRCTEQIDLVAEAGDGAFALGGEGKGSIRMFIGRRSRGPDGREGRRIILREGGRDAGKCASQFLLICSEGNDPVQVHASGRQCAGLIQTQDVRTGEGFNPVELLDERASASEAYDAYGQRHAGEQNQAFRDHADHGGNRLRHSHGQFGSLQEVLAAEQKNAQGYQDHAENMRQPCQVHHERRLGRADIPRDLGESCSIAAVADMHQLHRELALRDEGA